MKKVYLAIPYTFKHDDPRQVKIMQHARFCLANEYAAALMQGGCIVFSPISHSHTIALHNNLPVEWEFWESQDEAFIKWADIIVVVCIEGWKESTGVQAEIYMAEMLGKQIIYLDPDKSMDVNLGKIKENTRKIK